MITTIRMKAETKQLGQSFQGKKPGIAKSLVYLLPLVIMSLWFSSCTKEEPKQEEAKAFMLSDTMMSRITLDTVKTETVRNELTLVGKVVPDENQVIKIFPLVGGNVEDVNVELGDNVKKGQKLATIRSGEVADFEREMIQAQSDLLIFLQRKIFMKVSWFLRETPFRPGKWLTRHRPK
jgi:multidrug efflux pump subunit AcrA (membrane-fusion protein)